MPKVFLSYSRKDKEVADAITDFLRSHSVEVFIDYQKLQAGENYYARLAAEIKASDSFILLISANSLASEFVSRELEFAVRQKRRIIPVMLEARLELETWDFILGGLHRVNFTPWFVDRQVMDALNNILSSLGITPVIPPAAPVNPPPLQTPPATTPAQASQPQAVQLPPTRPPNTEQDRLLQELLNPATNHKRRKEIGDRLGEIGDTRPGTGITAANVDGRQLILPYLEWCDVPAPPGGKVWLGANYQTNNPRREVALNYSFKMAKFLITYRQFKTFADSGLYLDTRWWQGFPQEYGPQELDQRFQKAASYPRDNVSWYQAVAFTRWLTEGYRAAGWLDPHLEIRLPTGTEWEYAARGRDERAYPWGKWQPEYANTAAAKLEQTTAVGMYPQGASPFGMLDMSGNLWECCWNKYSNNSDSRELRGGSFDDNADDAACAYRYDIDPLYDNDDAGFRVVVAAPNRASDL